MVNWYLAEGEKKIRVVWDGMTQVELDLDTLTDMVYALQNPQEIFKEGNGEEQT